ncbi:MAG: glutamate-cysteine ligase family protein [Nitriliruptoraceae bacterium]
MPTRDATAALDGATMRAAVEAATSGVPGAAGLGLEVELFPIATDAGIQRSPILGEAGTLARLGASSAIRKQLPVGEQLSEHGWRAAGPDGCRTTFEPGGQIEISTCYHERPSDALASAEQATSVLAQALAPGISLAAAGIDVWAPGTAAQQRTSPRYRAMERYLAARSSEGRTMMCDTCALQLNLDLSVGTEAAERWSVTNLLAPVATATFASSPSPDGRTRSGRSLVWQQVDPTRTGFPPGSTDGNASFAERFERFVMDADVLLVTDVTGNVVPGRRGWRFADWMAHGHRRFGWPTAHDLDVHLSTLFPEVRPRGYLEVRSLDALPARWRAVPAVLYAGATYDTGARARILAVLGEHPRPDAQLLREAATVGLSDPSWCALAVEVWSFALEGASRLVPGKLRREDVKLAEHFLDRFTLRGRSPADELSDVLRTGGPMAALRWAAEPVSAVAGEPVVTGASRSRQEEM